MDPKQAQLRGGIIRWAVNTSSWNPNRTEWVTAMRLVGTDEERSRINRFVFKKDAKHALVGRLLIRKCCFDFIGAGQFSFSPENVLNKVTISRSTKGKPILVQIDSDGNQSPYEQFQFNISHSGDYCVLAADSSTSKLGIDIMKIEYSGGMNRINDFFRIMHRQFSESEWKYIQVPSSDHSKLARFIRLWSLKESLVKAEGSGIVFPLSKISFTCPTGLTSPVQKILSNSSVAINERPLLDWHFEESMIDRMHYVSVAKTKEKVTDMSTSATSQTEESSLHFKLLSVQDLLADALPSIGHLFTYDDEKFWTDFCRKT